MAVDGNWNITMSTPMGERKATLTLLSSGGTLTGTQGADGNSTEIFDGAIMLKRGWMLRYMPAIVTQTIPEYVTFAGYAWAGLCFVLGAGTIAVATTGDMKLWTFYVTVVLVGAKIAAFAIQYVAFRILVGSRIRAAAQRA